MGLKKIDEKMGNMIIELYNDGLSAMEISKKINGFVSDETIREYLKNNNVYKSRQFHSSYSYEDCVEIGELYKNDKWDEIFKKFPNIKKHTVYTICSKLNIRKELYFWSKEEEEILIKYYNNVNLSEIYDLLDGRPTENSISTKAKKMGLSKPKYWSEEENQILIENYSNVTKEEIIKLLPNRTLNAIMDHAKELGIKSYHYLQEKYSKDAKQFIIDNWQNMSDQEIAEVIGKNARGVMEQRNNMNLYRINKEYGKYENLAKLFRGHIQNWKNNSMELCDYKCVLTGSKDYVIHHIYSFNMILKEVFEKIEKTIPLISCNTTDYTKE